MGEVPLYEQDEVTKDEVAWLLASKDTYFEAVGVRALQGYPAHKKLPPP